jgi:hypothetical protein
MLSRLVSRFHHYKINNQRNGISVPQKAAAANKSSTAANFAQIFFLI